ncbi:hypothetical protein Poli38472_005334 [Pythium oligandrum]|uniref:Cytochrome P450 n=1 Tax=Pythium oligandrum TaxID=41045 RepID=A0A8K1FHH0_PYTOL|nr:hypothetical protein Poli38472_005334 [Pythium oligandrum]|eukprot:TMW62716.1 hypothetical protein Poli38472_005334 [Pythium oligandrum]
MLLLQGGGMMPLDAHSIAVVLLVLPVVYKLVPWLFRNTSKRPNESTKCPQFPSPPSTLPILGNTLDMVKHRPEFHDWIYSLCKHFDGKPFVLRTLGRPDLIMLSSPDQWEDVFKTHFENFPKGPYKRELLADILGEGIFASDGAK